MNPMHPGNNPPPSSAVTPIMAANPAPAGAARQKQFKKLFWIVFVIVILVHVLAGGIAGALVVARYLMKPEATFEARKDVRMPAKERTQKMNMAEFDALAPKPSFNDKLQALKPAPFALPELPKVPMDQMLPLDPSAIVSDQLNSMVGAAGLGSGTGGGGSGMGGTGAGFSFLGVQTTARRVLILYDVAASVVTATKRAGYSMSRISDETKKLLAEIGVNTRFGLGQFARNYAFFNSEMLPATDANRVQANEWLDKWFATSGTMKSSTPNMVRGSPGFIEVMKAAFKMQPDVIFVISDASFERGSGSSGGQIPFSELDDALRELQKGAAEPVRIHFIGVGMKPENKDGMRRVMGRHAGGGKFRELK